jgi:hypothetical protein
VKRITTGSLLISLQLLFACHSGGQVQKDYNIHFRSGTYLPVENVREVMRTPQLLSASRFNGVYYTILQFYSLPDSAVRATLAKNGVRLLHYLPQLAYVAAIPVETKLSFLKNINARSLFALTAEQKMAPELKKMNFPAWAVPQKGYVDIVVSTFETFDLLLLEKSISMLNGQVTNVQKEFATLTVRMPQKNLVSLAQLPFVFWVEVMEEPAKPETSLKNQEQ